jgi:hypothetical protein
MKSDPKSSVGRRGFLRTLGVGGVAVAAPLAGAARADTETDDQKRKARYQESEHVKKFYAVNRYPAKA